jgi:predicted ribosomally synthesized peptide with SipW-like signal peptide
VSMPRRSVLILAAIALVVAIGGAQTWAAYTATTASNANSFASGTVALTDNDSGAALLTLATAVPGDTDIGCITVTYTGSLASAVHLYGTTSPAGTGLDAYLDLRIRRGTFTGAAPAFDACTNFTPDATNYGAGSGVVYDGTLLAYPDDHAGGIVDPPAGGAESWTTGESHVYELRVTLRNDIAAKGKNATQTFTWEARNT